MDNPEVRTEQFLFRDLVIGFHEGEAIYRRTCLAFLGPLVPGRQCPETLLYQGQAHEAETDFLPLPEALLATAAGQRILAVDDEGRGGGRREGTTTLRVTYDLANRSITTAEVPGAETPLAITRHRHGLFGETADGKGIDVLLLAPQKP